MNLGEMRTSIIISFATLGSVALFLSVAYANATDRESPNMVVILADDLGIGDIGAYRSIYPGEDDKPRAYQYTTQLDRLAEQGILFTRAYATSWCAPSRQLLLSGQWANRTNAYDYPWIGAKLREQGYVTGIIGKSHGARATRKVFSNTDSKTAEFDDGLIFDGGMRDFYMKPGETLPGRRDFEEAPFRAEGGEYLTDVFTDRAVDFIARYAGSERPFMLYLAHLAPHSPLQGKPGDMRKLFPDIFGDMSDEEIQATGWPAGRGEKHEGHHYAALVYSLDRSVARIMEELEQTGVVDNTLVIFTSDNGAIHGSNFPLTGHKWDHLEGGIRVPFIVWSREIANSVASGSIYDGLVSLADIAPTLLALASDDVYAHPTDGIDLLPYAMGEQSMPTARRFFWANRASANFLSDFGQFDPKGEHREMVQSVLIEDHDKLLRWRIPGTTRVGAVHIRLPDAQGVTDPAKVLRERVPRAGELPEDEAGRRMLQEWRQLVLTQETLFPEWTAADPQRMKETEPFQIENDR
jgi:arylsulfatase A-like enzyme